MSEDILTRLQTPLPYNLVGLTTKDLGDERYEAADEIERLREQCDTMRDLISRITADRTQYAMRVQALEAEVTRLERLATNG